ncbi:MAG TPA: glycosyltransferase family 4 protein [Bacteroidales bacterium]|nr:glycosyltransferase family 4 protein [Bacteroidales bacterium]HOH22197.1 glycosyltransferase family 4 protein [Bacteroidales bacterium]HPZ02622.1 glycosyltransferase family 4 protein [Bacteroidales bacterium]HQB74479.1 glycosyltransferase family 4 protein [Bacteroidales bacterium]
MATVTLSVINDLYSDQRLDKVCNSLIGMGFDVKLVGRRYWKSPKVKRVYKTKRIHLLFKKGPFCYAEFNLRLFFYLLFQKTDILVANDLDTLLPNLLVSKIRRKKLVYDSHEYFLGVLEIQHRAPVKWVWTQIEKWCFPQLDHIITVSQSIVDLYREEYGKEVHLVRNIPLLREYKPINKDELKLELGIPLDQKVVIFQGNAIHRDRGGEEIVQAAPYIEQSVILIVGDGDMVPDLKSWVKEHQLEDKVIFTGRVAPETLRKYTQIAELGVTFDKNVSPNHYYSLPNKLFEYIHAYIPIVASNLPERKRIIETYEVGVVIDDLSPQSVATAINGILQDPKRYARYKENCVQATQELNWQKEELVLQKIYKNL